MNSIDLLLIDPAEQELAAALSDAVAAINRDQQGHGELLPDKSGDAAALAKDIRTRAEGFREWRVQSRGWRYSRQAELLAVWWGDFLGRKHVRLVGGCAHRDAILPVPGPQRPALACIYPEHCLFVSRAAFYKARLMVVCECGAFGTPEQIAWMGPHCGPCFDRQESDVRPTTGLTCQGSVHHVAFSPAGKHLATWDSENIVLWDLETGSSLATWEIEWSTGPGKLCFSHDGGMLGWWTNARLLTQLRGVGEDWRWQISGSSPFAFTPQGGAILYEQDSRLVLYPALPEAARISGCGDRDAWYHRWALDDRDWPEIQKHVFLLPFQLLRPGDLAVSPDGHLLAIAGGTQGLLFWDAHTGHPRAQVQMDNVSGPIAFSPDGTVLAVRVDRADPHTFRIALWDVSARRLRAWISARDTCHGFAFTADSASLVTCEGTDLLRTWDVHSALERRSVQLPAGDSVRSLALSPCGRLLALGMQSGRVYLWPADVVQTDV